MTAELWAVGIIVSLLITNFGYLLVLSGKVDKHRTEWVEELAKFRDHVQGEYAHNGTLEKAVNKMTDAFREFTAEFRTFQRDIHTGAIQIRGSDGRPPRG